MYNKIYQEYEDSAKPALTYDVCQPHLTVSWNLEDFVTFLSLYKEFGSFIYYTGKFNYFQGVLPDDIHTQSVTYNHKCAHICTQTHTYTHTSYLERVIDLEEDVFMLNEGWGKGSEGCVRFRLKQKPKLEHKRRGIHTIIEPIVYIKHSYCNMDQDTPSIAIILSFDLT